MSNLWITQLSLLLEDVLCQPFIHWNEPGNGIIIVDEDGFVKHVLPRYYDTKCGWASFQRNLSHYKFTRVHGVSEAYHHYYTHDMFHRDKKDNLHLVSPVFFVPIYFSQIFVAFFCVPVFFFSFFLKLIVINVSSFLISILFR